MRFGKKNQVNLIFLRSPFTIFAQTKKEKNMKIGDKVRFLSEIGGGIVSGFQGKDIA